MSSTPEPKNDATDSAENARLRARHLARYQDLRRYIEWSDDDVARIVAAAPYARPHFEALIDDFYAAIERHPHARRVITGGAAQVERLKRTLLQWVAELFSGRYDSDYLERRRRTGARHAEIGLPHSYASMAMTRLKRGLRLGITQSWPASSSRQELEDTLESLDRLLDLELAIISEAYETEHFLRKQRAERARLQGELNEAERRVLASERLAGIGQMITGLAHESRNALQRIQACAEMLELEVEGNAEALDLVARIQKAQDQLHRLFDEVRNYAAPIRLDIDEAPLCDAWREAWELLAAQRSGRQTELRECIEGVDLTCQVDRFRMSQVFRNIFENSLSACTGPAVVEIACANDLYDGQPALRIRVRDNGPGLNSEQRKNIFQPFYTTKTKGTGLGMAIAQRIVETHAGRIFVGDNNSAQDPPEGELSGAEIVILLPRTRP